MRMSTICQVHSYICPLQLGALGPSLPSPKRGVIPQTPSWGLWISGYTKADTPIGPGVGKIRKPEQGLQNLDSLCRLTLILPPAKWR